MAVVGLGFLDQPRQPEVGDFGVQFVVKQDVAGLHVSVVDGRDRGGVEVGKALRRLVSDPETVDPAEWGPFGGVVAMEVVEERSVGDVLVDEKRLLQLHTAAEHSDQALVVNLTQDSDLVQDLLDALCVSQLGSLDGRGGSIVEDPFEDLSKAARADEVGLGEVVGRFCYLFASKNSG